ncbi:MAG TPA: tetratricopeptide repeat protein [Alloacidobacterium sp.]|nr:tetratricopeptide repeat protein [Alloacidobacterium sp.]
MPTRRKKTMARASFMLTLAATCLLGCAMAQSNRNDPPLNLPGTSRLGLPQAKTYDLQQALTRHDYVKAETILLPEIQTTQQVESKKRLLELIGVIYFLDHDNLNAAIAWKKAEAIAPLPEPLQFSLAMAYVRMGHEDWAKRQLQTLARTYPKNALYPYWIGRIDYDSHAYEEAIAQFQKAIQLDPGMARAYDNLGLCFFYRNENPLAIENFQKAITLDRKAAWPHINLAAVLQVQGHLQEAESNLREAIQLEPGIAPAHFQLGNVLNSTGNAQAAIEQYKQAAQLDAKYAEPHFALARLYRRLGENSLAEQEVQIYSRLHQASAK